MWIINNNKLVILAFLILSAIFFASAIQTSNDTYWHLSVGRQIWQTKKIPTTDEFSYGPKNKNFTSVEWASDIASYMFVKTFGENNGLIAQRIIIATLILLLISRSLRLSTNDTTTILLGMAAVAYTIAFRFKDRPEIFSYLFLAFVNHNYLYYSLKKSIPRSFYFLPLIFLLWPNTHPYTILGLAIPAFYLSYYLICKILLNQKIQHAKVFLLVTITSILLALVQFQRTFIVLALGELRKHNLSEFNSLYSEIARSKGVDFFNQINYNIYLYSGLITVFAWIILSRTLKKEISINLTKDLFYFGFLIIPIAAFRLIPLSVIVAVPYLATKSLNINPKIVDICNKTILGILLVLILLSIPNRDVIGNRELKDIFFSTNPNTGQRTYVDVVNRLWNPNLPTKHVEIIKNNLKTKRIFTSTGWNNYFSWEIPGVLGFEDALFYNRRNEDYEDESIISEGRDGWQDKLKKYDIDTLVNPVYDFPFNTPIEKESNWQLVYVDQTARLYARKDIIKSLPADLSKIDLSRVETLKFDEKEADIAVKQLEALMNFDPKNDFPRTQLIEYYKSKKDYEKALSLAQDAKAASPKNPDFSMQIAEIDENQGKCTEAINFADEAKNKSYNDFFIMLRRDSIQKSCANL